MQPRPGDNLSELSEKISQCCEMLSTITPISQTKDTAPEKSLPSLLEKCDQLTAQVTDTPQPIRTLHHLACTGGTLISKCLACMPNTLLLSEVEPYSQIPGERQNKFFPTDLIMLLRNSSRGGDPGLEGEVFMAGLATIYKDCVKRGLRLLLRDHSHSQYCFKTQNSSTPKLRELIGDSSYPINSIVTLRHPLDAFLSLEKAGWLHFEPATFEEYCARTMLFLNDHAGLPWFKYEEFVEQPEIELEIMCDALGLVYDEGFKDLFPIHRLSGDSGRATGLIAPRERRPVPASLIAEADASPSYQAICQRLKYDASC
jgi:hypothetical protein